MAINDGSPRPSSQSVLTLQMGVNNLSTVTSNRKMLQFCRSILRLRLMALQNNNMWTYDGVAGHKLPLKISKL
ncbi:hypothetical protein C1752_03621 [Acaryochloris thomasi RCC1774]|uniref:Uncharacterized protein n=1 Tax=Acaryochloris thomasi RCC1774 TaxID=1764569 RepID=A0A2W1JFX0_9CYAN|nr:hypothetical protein C1752_03621 [Acaryochloris thomasi RCC1774]